jgi:uncharacterized damage-inducible protein DinB
VTLDEQGRTEPPVDGDELATLVGFLEFHRATFAWKCRGVDAAGLQARVGRSTMTLGGLLKHLTLVEESWFSWSLFDRAPLPPWDTVDWDSDPDWEWRTAAEDPPDELLARWEASVVRSRSDLDEALERGGPEQVAAKRWSDGRAPNLRWVLIHMIEEYARHNGHADLLREAVDGEVGE